MKLINNTILGLVALAVTNVTFAATNFIKIGGGVTYNSSSYKDKYNNGITDITGTDFKKNSFTSGFAKIEHGLSYVPNYRIESKTIKLKSSDINVEIKHLSNVLYYSFGLAIIDFQLGAIQDSFKIDNTKYSSTGVFSKMVLDIPLFPVTPSLTYSQGTGNDKVQSLVFNLAISLSPGLYLDLGTRNTSYIYPPSINSPSTKDKTISSNATYIGLSFNFGT